MRSRTVLWTIAALLGIAATATLAWTASQIAGQRIGLASEPLSVASGLAPPPDRDTPPRSGDIPGQRRTGRRPPTPSRCRPPR